MMNIKKTTIDFLRLPIKSILRRFGYDLSATKHKKSLIDFLVYYKIDVVFDVGANTGQFGSRLREIGYKRKIISFEPILSAFKELSEKVIKDNLWHAVNIGLGNYDGVATINTTNSSCFSSILTPLPRIINYDNTLLPIKKEEININKLDSIFDKFCNNGTNNFLKVDTQGFEKEILQGGVNSLKLFSGIQLELATIPLYSGQASFSEMVRLLDDSGFQLCLIEPVNYHDIEPSAMDFDCIFANKAIVKP